MYVHTYAAYDRFATVIFSLLLVYAWLFTCIQLRFATAIFLVWERKNRMTSEFRCMFPKYCKGLEISSRKSAVGCRNPHTCVRTLSCRQVILCITDRLRTTFY